MSLLLDKKMSLLTDRTHPIDCLMVYPVPSYFSPEKFVALSIFYPGAAAEREGYNIEYWDGRFDSYNQFKELMMQAKCIAISSMSGTQLKESVKLAEWTRNLNPFCRIILGGVHATVCKAECFDTTLFDYLVLSEGEKRFVELLNHIHHETDITKIEGIGFRDQDGTAVIQDPTDNLELLDIPAFKELKPDGTVMEHEEKKGWYVSPITSKNERYYRVSVPMLPSRRGCPYRCLSGDALVNTIFGSIAIADLARDYTDVPVYTYDRAKKEVVIAKATAIRKYGENEELLRVHFTDETWIDCTPDHKFLTFSREIENEIEARFLKPKQHIKAIRFETGGQGYVQVSWGRRKREYVHRLIMQYKIGRKLQKGELAHHLDHVKSNNHPDNIVLTTYKDHFEHHSEVTQRMQENNPAKNMTPEWRHKIGKASTGRKRSAESLEKYRQAKLGSKNPNWKPELHENEEVVNHKVAYVEKLLAKKDVYCLTVDGYGWFFSNNVLVKNCSMCSVPQQYVGRSSREIPFEYWQADVDKMLALWEENNPRLKVFELNDENSLSPNAMKKYMVFLRDKGILSHLHIRADQLRIKKNVEAFKEYGVAKVHIGMESGNPRVLSSVLLKDANPQTYVEVAEVLADVGVFAVYTAILGNPTETRKEMFDTLDLLDRLRLIHAKSTGMRATVYTLIPLPGTTAYEICKREGWKLPHTTREWGEFSAANNPNSKYTSNIYWISGLYYNQGSGIDPGKTAQNFGKYRWLIRPLEKLSFWRHRRRFYSYFDFERAIIERLVAWRSRQHRETEIVMSESLSAGTTAKGW